MIEIMGTEKFLVVRYADGRAVVRPRHLHCGCEVRLRGVGNKMEFTVTPVSNCTRDGAEVRDADDAS